MIFVGSINKFRKLLEYNRNRAVFMVSVLKFRLSAPFISDRVSEFRRFFWVRLKERMAKDRRNIFCVVIKNVCTFKGLHSHALITFPEGFFQGEKHEIFNPLKEYYKLIRI